MGALVMAICHTDKKRDGPRLSRAMCGGLFPREFPGPIFFARTDKVITDLHDCCNIPHVVASCWRRYVVG